jgi:hypothetical protein
VSTIQEIERAIEALPRDDVQALRDWIENYLEDELQMTDEFTAKIERSEQEMADGKGQVRHRPPPS